MPVEIKEITIRTEVRTTASTNNVSMSEKELSKWKSQVLNECKKMIALNLKTRKIKR
ncbi:MAG: DUF5908 family protein [Crocinitomicaceae bacterium]